MKFKFLLVAFLLTTSIFAQEWTQKNDFPVTGINLSSFVFNNEAYVLVSIEAKLYKYDANQDSWSSTTVNWMENMGYQDGFVMPIGNKVYVAAGLPSDPSNNQKIFYEFDPTTNIWTQKNDLPNFIALSSSQFPNFSYNNKGYILYSGKISTYDPITDMWEDNISAYPNSPYNFNLSHFVIDDKFYAGSGNNSAIETSPNFFQYDPEQNTWIDIAPYPDTLQPSNMLSFVINKTAYTGMGAYTSGGGFDYNPQYYSYSPSNDSWSLIPDCGYSAKNGFSFTLNGKGYVGTGWTTAPNLSFYDDIWEYTPSTTLNIEEYNHSLIEIGLYPNPTSGLLNFKTDRDVSKIQIVNLLGQQIKEFQIKGNNQIDIKELQNGVYILSFFDEHRKLESKMIFKE